MEFAHQAFISATKSPNPNERMVRLIAVVILTVLGLLPYYSARIGKVLNKLFGVFKILMLCTLIIKGAIKANNTTVHSFNQDDLARRPSLSSAPTALLVILYSYQGWEDTAFIAGENATHRNSRIGSTVAVFVVGILYLLVNAVFLVALPYTGKNGPYAPKYFGDTARAQQAWAALVAISACGSLISMIQPDARVKQAVTMSILRFRLRTKWWNARGMLVPTSQVRWTISVNLISASSAMGNLNKTISFPGLLHTYVEGIFGVLIGCCYLFLRSKRSKRSCIFTPPFRYGQASTGTYEPKILPLPKSKMLLAVFYISFNLAILILPLIPSYRMANGSPQKVLGWSYIVLTGVVMVITMLQYTSVFQTCFYWLFGGYGNSRDGLAWFKFVVPVQDNPDLSLLENSVPRQKWLDQFVLPSPDVSNSESPLEAKTFTVNGRVIKFTPWTMTPRPGVVDEIKGVLEKWIRNPIVWWPLQPKTPRCSNGYIRVSWPCTCGDELFIDVPDEVAKEYQKRCSPAASSSSTQSVLPTHNTSSRTSLQTQNASLPSFYPFRRSSLQNNMKKIVNSAAAQSFPQPSQYIHWCVDASKHETKLNHIPILALDDVTIIQKLKSAYNDSRGFRRWISLTVCYGVRFVAFERAHSSRELVACGQEDLPPRTNREYAYSYHDPRELFIKTLERSIMHSFHNCGGCSPRDIEDIITRIPKKLNGILEKKYGVLGYGMHALPGWAVWKLMVALGLSQLGPLIFFIRWLYGHPGDLQSAFSLSMFLLALLNIVVVIPDIWGFQK